MSRTRKLLIAVIGLVLVLIAAVAIYLGFIREDAPDELTLGDRQSTLDGDAASGEASADSAASDNDSSSAGADTATSAPAPTTEAPLDTVDGTWQLIDESVAGYRVVEDFPGGVSDFEAVGRNEPGGISGSITVVGTQITEGGFSIEIESIKSDSNIRDNQFTGAIMNAADFPTADFVLTQPIELGEVPSDGQEITATAVGELTLRDVTNAVSFEVQARLVGREIETAGQIDVLFSDYSIDNPSNRFVQVRNEGKVEFSLIFAPQ